MNYNADNDWIRIFEIHENSINKFLDYVGKMDNRYSRFEVEEIFAPSPHGYFKVIVRERVSSWGQSFPCEQTSLERFVKQIGGRLL